MDCSQLSVCCRCSAPGWEAATTLADAGQMGCHMLIHMAIVPMCMHVREPIWPASASLAGKLQPSYKPYIYKTWPADCSLQVFRTSKTAMAPHLFMVAEVSPKSCDTVKLEWLQLQEHGVQDPPSVCTGYTVILHAERRRVERDQLQDQHTCLWQSSAQESGPSTQGPARDHVTQQVSASFRVHDCLHIRLWANVSSAQQL